MRYAKLIKNDIVDGEGVCVSLWFQGCGFRCKNCQNPQTWDKNGGMEIAEEELIKEVIEAIDKNGIKRNFSVLGGEPLAPYNVSFAAKIIKIVRQKFPNIKIYLWTGYVFENLNEEQKTAISDVDILIDGPFMQDLRDITLPLRGSSNQRIIKVRDFE